MQPLRNMMTTKYSLEEGGSTQPTRMARSESLCWVSFIKMMEITLGVVCQWFLFTFGDE